jgi:transposase
VKHLARFVVDLDGQLDLSNLENHHGGGGKQPYHPALLLALLFYGYATGVISSRKLEQVMIQWRSVLSPVILIPITIPSPFSANDFAI